MTTKENKSLKEKIYFYLCSLPYEELLGDKFISIDRGEFNFNISRIIKQAVEEFIEKNFYWEDGILRANWVEWYDWKDTFKEIFGFNEQSEGEKGE